MPVLDEAYKGASCVIKTKKNDLLTMGTLGRIKESYIDITSSRNELPELPYNMLVKIEIYNSQIGFRVLLGNVYISSPKLVRIIHVSEAAVSEKREFFRINVREPGYLYDENSEEFQVELMDISLGGLLFKTTRHYDVGEELSIRIPILESTAVFHCIVRRHVEVGKGDLGYGCEFVHMSIAREDELYKFMLKKQNDQLKRMR